MELVWGEEKGFSSRREYGIVRGWRELGGGFPLPSNQTLNQGRRYTLSPIYKSLIEYWTSTPVKSMTAIKFTTSRKLKFWISLVVSKLNVSETNNWVHDFQTVCILQETQHFDIISRYHIRNMVDNVRKLNPSFDFTQYIRNSPKTDFEKCISLLNVLSTIIFLFNNSKQIR